MTLDQVRTLYPSATGQTDHYWTILTLPNVTIGDIRLSASAGAKLPSDRITQVNLWLSFGAPSAAPLASPQDFETLRTLLIQKYGGHTHTATTKSYGDVVLTVTWTFAHSTIALSMRQGESAPGIGSDRADGPVTIGSET